MQSSRADYTLRVPIRPLGEMPITGLDGADPIDVDGLKIQMRSVPPLLVITVAGFASYDAAVAFIPRVIAGLWGLVVRWNIAFRADFTPQVVTYAEDPESAGNNLARAFGQASGPAVDGIVRAADVVAYRSDARLRWLGMGRFSPPHGGAPILSWGTVESALSSQLTCVAPSRRLGASHLVRRLLRSAAPERTGMRPRA
jgi:hypothetical protein